MLRGQGLCVILKQDKDRCSRMNASAQNLIAEFDRLDISDRREVAVEILRRVLGEDELPGHGFAELANEALLTYDAEETASANG